MPLSDRQRIAMRLAGTVPIPSPHPAFGRIEVLCPVLPLNKVRKHRKTSTGRLGRFLNACHVTAIHEISPRMTVTRTVGLGDVTALYLPGDDPSAGYSSDPRRWMLPETLRGLVVEFCVDRAESDGVGDGRLLLSSSGVVFVPEATQVLVQVEAGMTAAESEDCSHMFPRLCRPDDPAECHFHGPVECKLHHERD